MINDNLRTGGFVVTVVIRCSLKKKKREKKRKRKEDTDWLAARLAPEYRKTGVDVYQVYREYARQVNKYQ